jgi:hypothetical protein
MNFKTRNALILPMRYQRGIDIQMGRLTSPTSGGSSVGIVRLRTKATEFSFTLFPMRSLDVSIDLTHSEPGVDSASSRSEYQESSWE